MRIYVKYHIHRQVSGFELVAPPLVALQPDVILARSPRSPRPCSARAARSRSCSSPSPTRSAQASSPASRGRAAKGNAGQLRTRQTPSRISVTQDAELAYGKPCRPHPRWEQYAGKPHITDLRGGREVTRVSTAKGTHLAAIDHSRCWHFSTGRILRDGRRERSIADTRRPEATAWRDAFDPTRTWGGAGRPLAWLQNRCDAS